MSGVAPRNPVGPGGGDLQLPRPRPPPRRTPLFLHVVEYQKSGPLLREDEEDLEVKLCRIIENVPVRVSNTSGSSAGSSDFHQYRQITEGGFRL